MTARVEYLYYDFDNARRLPAHWVRAQPPRPVHADGALRI